MEKNIIILVAVFTLTMSLSSQNLYFDIGLGAGKGVTKLDGRDVSDDFNSSVDEACIDLGLKLGVGPIAGTPIYIVGAFSAVGHRFEGGGNYIQFNSYIIGPGIVIYPIPLLQISATAGYSFINNVSDLPVSFYDSESGYGGDISLALDLGGKKHGCLIGVKYTMTKNTLKVSGVEQESTLLSIFVRYAFRNK